MGLMSIKDALNLQDVAIFMMIVYMRQGKKRNPTEGVNQYENSQINNRTIND